MDSGSRTTIYRADGSGRVDEVRTALEALEAEHGPEIDRLAKAKARADGEALAALLALREAEDRLYEERQKVLAGAGVGNAFFANVAEA